MTNEIIDLCNSLNEAIHEPLYHNFYNIPNELKYNQTFTSIDLIEDSQIAINGGLSQPATFEVNVPMDLEDCDGMIMQVTVKDIQGRVSLIEFVKPIIDE